MDLGTINANQKMTGVRVQAQDANGNPVIPFNGLTLSVDQPVVSFANISPTSDLPVGSTFTADLLGLVPSAGAATITASGQAANGAVFTGTATITVVANPNVPGPPVTWVFTAGAIVSQ